MSWCVYAVRCRWRRLDFLHSPGVHSSVKMLSIKSSTSSESKMWRKGAGLVGFEMGKGQQIDTVRIQVRDPYKERSHLFLSVLASILWICIYQFYVCINMSLYSNQKTPCLVIIFSCNFYLSSGVAEISYSIISIDSLDLGVEIQRSLCLQPSWGLLILQMTSWYQFVCSPTHRIRVWYVNVWIPTWNTIKINEKRRYIYHTWTEMGNRTLLLLHPFFFETRSFSNYTRKS